MNNENIKTAIDLRFEHYLHQENINTFTYEPFGSIDIKLKNPDYLVTNRSKSALIEVKEIESIQLDHLRGMGSMDAMDEANIMRKKIYEASKQLKSYKKKTDYAIILLGKNKGFDLNVRDLEWAMFGDPVIRIPLNVKKGLRAEVCFDMKVKGAMRKNDPITKQMYFPSSYISAVGIIKEVNGYNYFFDQLCEKYMSPYNQKIPPDIAVEKAFKEIEEIRKKYENTIPKIYFDDKKKSIVRLELIANALSNRPLPESFFLGKYDSYKIHKVVRR